LGIYVPRIGLVRPKYSGAKGLSTKKNSNFLLISYFLRKLNIEQKNRGPTLVNDMETPPPQKEQF